MSSKRRDEDWDDTLKDRVSFLEGWAEELTERLDAHLRRHWERAKAEAIELKYERHDAAGRYHGPA
jgi:hypothetical protein